MKASQPLISLRNRLVPHRELFLKLIAEKHSKRKASIRKLHKSELKALILAVTLVSNGTIPISRKYFAILKHSRLASFAEKNIDYRKKFNSITAIDKLSHIAKILHVYLHPLVDSDKIDQKE